MLAYGKNVLLMMNPKEIKKVYISKNDVEIKNFLKENKIHFVVTSNDVLNKMVKGNHQGVVIEREEFKYFELKDIQDEEFLVILDHLEDPHNFGAIIRTSEALGVDAIIIPNDRSVDINATVVKTSAGAIYNMPIIRVANLTSAINKLKNNGYWIVGSDMDGIEYTNVDYKIPICLVIGNEGHGMSKVVSNNCDYIVKIPMIGNINSLNASVSCGILLAQIVNSRR